MTVTIAEIASALGVEALGDAAFTVERPAEPGKAGPRDLALAMSLKWADALKDGQAQAAVLWPGADWQALGLRAAICPPRARLAMAHLTQALDWQPPQEDVHPTAVIDARATIGKGVFIGPFTVIGPDAVVEDGCQLGAQVVIGEGSVVGADSWLHPGVRIGRRVLIGRNAILHPNAVIGADGFSFVTATPSNEEVAIKTMGRVPMPEGDGQRHRIHSLGGVIIGNDVEIGANSTVDAGTIRPTRVGDGCKIDNLVQVGHNVVLGRDCVLCAQAAVAGSAVLGDRVVMGGKSGIKDNVTVGRDVVLGGAAIVLGDVADGQFMMGYPALPMMQFRAQQKALRRLMVSKPDQSD